MRGVGTVLKPTEEARNHFALLGVDVAFDLEAHVLEAAYLARSRQVHPDRFVSAPASERVVALSASRALNDAYQVLRKPVSRAEYLLSMAGITIGNQERLDPATLMEILELREELASARAAGNTQEVGDKQRAMRQRKDQLVARLSPLFASGTHAHLLEAKGVLILLRYVDRYLDECEHALDDE
jgi:molecular chaperone HscB